MDKVETFYAPSRPAWRAWLTKNHQTKQSVWLVYDKGPDRQLSPADITEEALCFGWIDSVPGKVSDTQAKIYVAKRKPKSAWSKINKERAERMIKEKLMAPAGMKMVETAKQNGMWDHLEKTQNDIPPPELVKALSANPKAKAFYDSMPPSSHRIILEWIYGAKTQETKMKRISETVELAAQGIKAHHYRQ